MSAILLMWLFTKKVLMWKIIVVDYEHDEAKSKQSTKKIIINHNLYKPELNLETNKRIFFVKGKGKLKSTSLISSKLISSNFLFFLL